MRITATGRIDSTAPVPSADLLQMAAGQTAAVMPPFDAAAAFPAEETQGSRQGGGLGGSAAQAHVSRSTPTAGTEFAVVAADAPGGAYPPDADDD